MQDLCLHPVVLQILNCESVWNQTQISSTPSFPKQIIYNLYLCTVCLSTHANLDQLDLELLFYCKICLLQWIFFNTKCQQPLQFPSCPIFQKSGKKYITKNSVTKLPVHYNLETSEEFINLGERERGKERTPW